MAQPPQPGAEQLAAINKIHGKIAHASSESQYNLEVKWVAGAEEAFRNAWGWTPHVSSLHAGMHGYQQEKNGDPFLGIVVLFKDDDSSQGQFHVGFMDLWWHFLADNGNVEENYFDYCHW